jgi:hypothetical protein
MQPTSTQGWTVIWGSYRFSVNHWDGLHEIRVDGKPEEIHSGELMYAARYRKTTKLDGRLSIIDLEDICKDLEVKK